MIASVENHMESFKVLEQKSLVKLQKTRANTNFNSVLSVYMYQAYLMIYFQYMQFIVCQRYLNKSVLKREKEKEKTEQLWNASQCYSYKSKVCQELS
jgi:hypothetical protein